MHRSVINKGDKLSSKRRDVPCFSTSKSALGACQQSKGKIVSVNCVEPFVDLFATLAQQSGLLKYCAAPCTVNAGMVCLTFPLPFPPGVWPPLPIPFPSSRKPARFIPASSATRCRKSSMAGCPLSYGTNATRLIGPLLWLTTQQVFAELGGLSVG